MERDRHRRRLHQGDDAHERHRHRTTKAGAMLAGGRAVPTPRPAGHTRPPPSRTPATCQRRMPGGKRARGWARRAHPGPKIGPGNARAGIAAARSRNRRRPGAQHRAGGKRGAPARDAGRRHAGGDRRRSFLPSCRPEPQEPDPRRPLHRRRTAFVRRPPLGTTRERGGRGGGWRRGSAVRLPGRLGGATRGGTGFKIVNYCKE